MMYDTVIYSSNPFVFLQSLLSLLVDMFLVQLLARTSFVFAFVKRNQSNKARHCSISISRMSLRRTSPRELIKFYYDFKSPYTYLAFDPILALEKDYSIQVRFIPWAFRMESFGGNLEQRKEMHWNKVRYLYLDCRRFANERGLIIRGPERLFNSRLSLIAGLYADKHQFFPSYARLTFERFFNRQLNLENVDEIIKTLHETSTKNLSLDALAQDFQQYAQTEGEKCYNDAEKEAEADRIFGVPTVIIRGEPFWGNDRLSWIKKRLDTLQLSNA